MRTPQCHLAFAPFGGLRLKQAVGLALARTPMSTLALLMVHDVGTLFPSFAHELGPMFLAGLLAMEIIGPFAVQAGFTIAGETVPSLTGRYRALAPEAAERS